MTVSVSPDGLKDGFALAKAEGVTSPLALVVDEKQRDLAFVPEPGQSVEIITSDEEAGREIMRHSAAHVMAQAVLELYPGTNYSIGPPIQDGFYYDFEVERPFTPEDLQRIEAEMRRIVGENQRFEREEIGRIKAFKLLKSAGAYWRGDEKRPMLQRIYGTAWESKDALDSYLHRLEEAERRDHRKLGRDLELFSWPEEVGPGLAVWHPKGAIVRKELEDLAREMHLDHGYKPVYTPHIGKSTLWETSGHLGFYRESMYPPMELEGAEYFAKPMNCPFHVLVYRSKTRSYKELPLRLSELGTVYRYERSGVLHGLLRARGLTQDDSHIFCQPDQVVDELVGVVDFFRALYQTVGLGPDAVRFSTKPPKAVGSQEMWDMAESAIPQALEKADLDYTIDEGDGAFYGPKIDIDARDAIGRYWQLCTIQVDFQMPGRFGITYIDEHGERIRPVMIHRALFGSIERFVGVLTEHFGGAFPTWLAPVQVVLVPVADRHVGYARSVEETLNGRGVRVEVDDSDNTMGAKIRHHQLQKVPYMLVVGDAEVDDESVSVRRRSGEESRGVSIEEFASDITGEIAERRG